MKKKNIYEYLDNEGIEEMINVILEILDKQFVDDLTPVTSNTDEASSSKDILQYIEDTKRIINNVKLIDLAEVKEEVNRLHEEAMYDANIFTHLYVKLVYTPLEEIDNPRDDIIYLQQSPNNPNVWNMCIYDDGWVVLGENNYELHNCYSKNDPEFENKVLDIIVQRMSFDDIKRAVFEAAIETNMLDTRILAHLGLYTFE